MRRTPVPGVLAAATALAATACAPTPGTSRTAPPPPTQEAPAQVAVRELARPVAVRLPRLGIEARLQPLGLDVAGALRPPAYGRAGWYEAGPEPGEPGAAVIAGHLDSASGPDVFAALSQARPGMHVSVDLADGTVVSFRVTTIQQYPQSRFPTRRVYADGARPLLRLVTCGGAYDRTAGRYRDNVVVYAARARLTRPAPPEPP